jgi:hypothetical protein
VAAAEVTMRARWRPLLLLWAGSWCAFLCTAFGNLENVDSAITMHGARALWLRGDSGLLRSDDGAGWLAEQLIADTIARNSGVRYGKTGADGRHQYVWFPVGHVWLMVPCLAAGEPLVHAFPEVEQRYRDLYAPALLPRLHEDERAFLRASGQFVFDHAAVALSIPPAFGATTVLLLFLLAAAFGCTDRQALLAAATVAVGTQCFPLARETLSDGPGLAFLLGALLAVVRVHQGKATPAAMVFGGFAAGAAVLTRYPHALLVIVLGAVVARAAGRQRRWSLLLAFAAGGLPCALLLFGTNWARYGDPFETGYPQATSWFNYPIWFGLPKLLIAAGKGILWFSPVLWLAVPAALRRERVPALRWLAWTLLLVPLLLFSSTNGWQSGQCWGARYVTAGVVAFLALVLPQSRPWQRWPRLFALLLGLGLAVNVTSLLAPTRGYDQLAGQAVRAMYRQELERGEISELDFRNLDEADHFSFLPRFSPLRGNWIYAWRSLTGAFEDEQGQPRDGAANTIEPLFGITSAEPGDVRAPLHWEDRGFRHLWWRFWGDLLGIPGWLLLLAPLGGAVLFLRAAVCRLAGASAPG